MRRVLLVAFLLLLSALMWAPDVRRLAGHPLGIAGVSFNYDGVVTAVDPRSAYSGIRVGDRIDLSRATLEQRTSYAGLGTADAGMHVSIPMLRGDARYTAHVITFPEGAERIQMIWLRDATQIFVMIVGALVLLRRPGPATWGFFLVLFSGSGPVNVVYLLGPHWWRVAGINLFWLIANNGVGAYGAIIFAIYLLHSGPLPRWRRITQAVTLALAAAMFAASIWQANTLAFASAPNGRLWLAYSVLSALPLFMAPVILIATYFESSANLRERLRWIIGGFVLSAICNALDLAGSQGNLGVIQESYVVHSLLVAGTSLFIAVPVAYAVLKHHIIDVSVAISRATAYTALSVFTVGAFTLVDFFFSHALDQKSAGLVADIGLALILGFSFNTLHRRVDSFVDRFLFRKRHRAEEHVAGVAAAMAYAHSEEHVHSMLTSEPVRRVRSHRRSNRLRAAACGRTRSNLVRVPRGEAVRRPPDGRRVDARCRRSGTGLFTRNARRSGAVRPASKRHGFGRGGTHTARAAWRRRGRRSRSAGGRRAAQGSRIAARGAGITATLPPFTVCADATGYPT